MRKTILTLAMMMAMALTVAAGPAVKAAPAGKANVEFKGDTIVVTDGDKAVAISGLPEMQKVRDKINRALDDTLTAGNGTTIEIGDYKGDLSPEDIKELSGQWASVAKMFMFYSVWGAVGIVLLILLFRFLNRRSKYRVMEKAIENNYPLNDLSLTDVKRSAIYVQQPVVAAAPPMNAASQPGQVPVGMPIEGKAADNPVVVSNMVNWRALMPAVKWMAWGLAFILFSRAAGDGNDPFWPIGVALMFVGACKGYILYQEQKTLQDAWQRAEHSRQQQQEPMREGIPVPPPLDEDYKEDNADTYQPY